MVVLAIVLLVLSRMGASLTPPLPFLITPPLESTKSPPGPPRYSLEMDSSSHGGNKRYMEVGRRGEERG